MLSPTSIREMLCACPPSPTWNLASFTVESTVSSPCSRSDPPLSRQGAALAHLDSLPPHDQVIWADGSIPFFFGNGGCGVPGYPLLFWQAQNVQVFPLNPALFCNLFVGLGSIHNSAISLFFSFPTLALSSPLWPFPRFSFYLNLPGRNSFLFPPVLSGYNGSPDARLSRKTTRLMSWPDGSATRALCNPLLPLSYPLFSFLRLEAYCLIKILRHTCSFDFHQEIDASSSRSLCFLSSTLQWTQPTVKPLSLGLAES